MRLSNWRSSNIVPIAQAHEGIFLVQAYQAGNGIVIIRVMPGVTINIEDFSNWLEEFKSIDIELHFSIHGIVSIYECTYRGYTPRQVAHYMRMACERMVKDFVAAANPN